MILVAYDVTSAVAEAGQTHPSTGVARVIRGVLGALLRGQPEFDVRTVGCFGGDWNPASTSLRAEAWASHSAPTRSCAWPAFRSRTGLARLCGPLQLRWEEACNRAAAEGVRPRWRSLALRILRRLVLMDIVRELPTDKLDVFCSTFLSPPEFLSPRVPRAIFIHDVIPMRLAHECGTVPYEMLKKVLASLDPKRDVVVTNSHYTKEDFCGLTSFPSERVFVAPLAADDAFRPVRDERSIADMRRKYDLSEDPYFLSVANPQPRKNLSRTIRSFYRMAEARPDWQGNLVLAGDEKVGCGIEEWLRVIEKEPSLTKRVKRIGRVAEEDLPALYSGAEALVFPSLYEGFGLPVLEAMQCGAAVICSGTTSLPEVAGEAALLVNPLSEDEITEAMCTLAGDPALRRRYSEKAVIQAAKFSWETCAASVAAAFRFALSPPPSSRLDDAGHSLAMLS